MWFGRARLHRAALLAQQAVWSAPGGTTQVLSAKAAAGADEPVWRPALNALLQALKSSGQRPGDISLTLGAGFVRWQLVDWPASVGSPAELAAAVRLRLRAVHGTVAGAWHILHADVSPGQAVPACAIDTALLQALRQDLREAGWRLNALQPYAAAALDHWRGQWRRGPAWVAVVEPDHLTLALFERGQWRGLRSVRCHGDAQKAWQALLPGLQAQLGMRLDAPPSTEVPGYVIGSGADGTPDAAWHRLTPAGDASRREGLARLAWGH